MIILERSPIQSGNFYIKLNISASGKKHFVILLFDNWGAASMGRANKNACVSKKCCSMTIKRMILRTVSFYFRHVQLGSVIHPNLKCPSSPSNGRLSAENPLRKLQTRVKTTHKFPFVLLHIHNDTWMRSCTLFPWENGIPEKVIHTSEKTFEIPQEDSMR